MNFYHRIGFIAIMEGISKRGNAWSKAQQNNCKQPNEFPCTKISNIEPYFQLFLIEGTPG